MTTMFRIDLGETEDLRVCERSAVLFLQTVQIFYLLRTERQPLLFVVFLQIVHILNGFRLDVDGEDILVQAVIHTL